MKQKIVIKVNMNGNKSRTKCLKVAVGVLGVESAALGGEDKSQIEVIGDGIDSVNLTTLLRKNVGYAELVSVGEAEKKKEENKEPATVQSLPYVWPYNYGVPHYSSIYEIGDTYPVQYHYNYGLPHYSSIYEIGDTYPVQYHYNDPNCSIM